MPQPSNPGVFLARPLMIALMAQISCQICHDQPATVHLTEIIDGVKHEFHYCDACAEKEGVGVSTLTPQSFFGGLVDQKMGSEGEEAALVCPMCGLTYAEFRQRGRLGCAECYGIFKEGLVQLLERIHGSTQHLGRVPTSSHGRIEVEREVIELQRELSRVIQREEYERAAEIRDRIREMEEQRSSGTD